MLGRTPGEAMTAAPEATANDIAVFSASNVATNRPRQSAMNVGDAAKISAKSAAFVITAAAMWLALVAMILVV
jgi:hypothetical protein